jgi:fibrillarin-like pre-rRNA processing protein
MRVARALRPFRESPRLVRREGPERTDLWTETVGVPPAVYGERWIESNGRDYRLFEPGRSKLAAAIARGWTGDLPRPGERWLYLGAATGTTASHVADLVGPAGRVYAVEKSARPFARLYTLSARWPNLLPILGDARAPRTYSDLVPNVDGVYADIAQPDQLSIVQRNAELFLRGAGSVMLVALKTASMGREQAPAAHLARGEEELESVVDLDPSVKLDPFHRAHYLLGGRSRPALFGEAQPRAVRPRPGRSHGPRRR